MIPLADLIAAGNYDPTTAEPAAQRIDRVRDDREAQRQRDEAHWWTGFAAEALKERPSLEQARRSVQRAIYRRIGYQPIVNVDEYRLRDRH